MNETEVLPVASVEDVADALTVPWTRDVVAEWVHCGQLYCAGTAPFLTGAGSHPLTADGVRVLRFGAAPDRAELRAALRWAAREHAEPTVVVEAPGAMDLLGVPGEKVVVERWFRTPPAAPPLRSGLRDAPPWVRSGLADSLRAGAAARDQDAGDPPFDEGRRAAYLAALDRADDVFVYRLPDGELAAVGHVGEDEWDGADRVELLDLVGAELRRADDLLAGVAAALGVQRVLGRVTTGRDPNAPRVLRGLLDRGWTRCYDQVLLPTARITAVAAGCR